MINYFSRNQRVMLLFILIFLTAIFSGCIPQTVSPPIDNHPQDSPAYLSTIEVLPDVMDLQVNNSLSIIQVIAYYSNASTKSISLNSCAYDSNNLLVASVSSNGIISGLSSGTAIVSVTYAEGFISKTDTVIVNVNNLPVTTAELNSIDAQPTEMNLNVGTFETINTITAFYDNGTSKDINLNDCDYTSEDTAIATISAGGNVTAISEGNTSVTVSYTEKNITKTDSVLINVEPFEQSEVAYRAFLVGVGDYINDDKNDLSAPPYDVNRMRQILQQCQFGDSNATFSTINTLKDWQATKSNILQGISSSFAGADENDISYFYFSGHGSLFEGTSYICPSDITSYINSAISVNQLENALSAIPGTKVVFLDSCHSGGFIGKGFVKTTKTEGDIETFNENVMQIFSQSYSKSLLTGNEYKVLTSCHYYQSCYELYPQEGNPFGAFTMALCNGAGYTGSYPADTNSNHQVSLNEAYFYVKNWVNNFDIVQDVQVFPNSSSFPIVEY